MLNGNNLWHFGIINDMGWEVIHNHEVFTYKNKPNNLYETLLNSANKYPDRVALCDNWGHKDTYSSFLNKVTLFAQYLQTVNVRKGKHYTDINYDWLEKGWDVSAVSFHKVMKLAWDKDCMNEWGSILALTYIAAQRIFPDYNDMADNKSYLESIARSFGYFWGERKVRVNTISQSPTMTTAGQGVKGFDGFINFAEDMSPLGNATAAECADYCISLFSDLTRKVTMQNLFHDGGFSNTGVSTKVMDKYQG